MTLQPVPDGQPGELVFTSPTKQAMPIIRYRTRDLTRLLPPTALAMRRIEKITGRTDDMIILRGVNLFPTQIEELILAVPELAPHFQCVLSRTDKLDKLTVRRAPPRCRDRRRGGRDLAGGADQELDRRHRGRGRAGTELGGTFGGQDAPRGRRPPAAVRALAGPDAVHQQ